MTFAHRVLLRSLLCAEVCTLAPGVVSASQLSERLAGGGYLETYRMLALAILGLLLVLGAVQARRRVRPDRDRLAAGEPDPLATRHPDDQLRGLVSSLNYMAGSVRHQLVILQAQHRPDGKPLARPAMEPILEIAAHLAGKVVHASSVALAAPRVGLVSAGGGQWSVATTRNGGRPDWDTWEPAPHELEELLGADQHLMVEVSRDRRTYLGARRPAAAASFLVLPLRRGEEVAGLLAFGFGRTPALSPEQVQHARQMADQVAIALSNAQLVEELDGLSEGALTALARAIDAASPWTSGHSERVTAFAVEIARRMGLGEAELIQLHRGGLLHDIGKIGVPQAILEKQGSLTRDERRRMEVHTTTGARILAPIASFRDIIPLVRSHHELLDGSGYPDGLRGDEIPPLVRILTVADVFDALVSERPYRTAWPAESALGELRRGVGRHFDPLVVETFEHAVRAGWGPPEQAPVSVPGRGLRPGRLLEVA